MINGYTRRTSMHVLNYEDEATLANCKEAMLTLIQAEYVFGEMLPETVRWNVGQHEGRYAHYELIVSVDVAFDPAKEEVFLVGRCTAPSEDSPEQICVQAAGHLGPHTWKT